MMVSAEQSENMMIIGVEDIEDDFEVEDLTDAFNVYQEKLNFKKKDEVFLKGKSITYEPPNDCFITIDSVTIEKVTLRIGKENDFDFIKTSGVNFSGSTKRVRVKQTEDSRYFSIILANLFLRCSLGNVSNEMKAVKADSPVHCFVSLEKIRLSMCKLKNFGHDSLRRLETVIPQQPFIIFANENEICFILEKDEGRILLKSYALKIKVGVTSQLVSMLKLIKNCEK